MVERDLRARLAGTWWGWRSMDASPYRDTGTVRTGVALWSAASAIRTDINASRSRNVSLLRVSVPSMEYHQP